MASLKNKKSPKIVMPATHGSGGSGSAVMMMEK
jgi:hypothetical protein